MVAKRGPLRSIHSMEQPNSLGARSGECDGWVMTGISAEQAMCGSVRYRDAETLLLVAPIPPNCIAQPLQNLHVEMTTLSRRYELMVHQTVDVKLFRDFFFFFFLTQPRILDRSRDSSLCMATGHTNTNNNKQHTNHMPGVRLPAKAKAFSRLCSIHTHSGAQPASYWIGIRGSFPGGKAFGA
jgi:hypothetical protein